MKRLVKKLIKKTSGQGLAEYSILIAFISIALISSVFLLGGENANGECNKNNSSSNKFIGSHEYVKNDDTGIISLYKNVTCKLGGWKNEDDGSEDEGDFTPGEGEQSEYNVNLTALQAWQAGFSFPLFSRSKIIGFDGTLEGNKLIIPKTIRYFGRNRAVEIIDDGVFKNKGIEHIVIPESVKTIGFEAFADNPNLKTVTILGENTIAKSNSFPEEMGMDEKLKPGTYTRK